MSKWVDIKYPPKAGEKVELLLKDGTIVESKFRDFKSAKPEDFWNWEGVKYKMLPTKWRKIKTTNKKKKEVITDGSVQRDTRFEELCRLPQKELKNHLKQRYNMESGDGYLYHKGTIPILLTAHMDTVHSKSVATIVYANGTISSDEGIGGDDRCGIYMIENIIDEFDCSVLFFEDEETGSVGAKKFIKTKLAAELKGAFKYCIELDRAHDKDCVFYDCDNKAFTEYITGKEYWTKATGTWSDCCAIGPELDCAIVNLSCGYYKAHTTDEYVVLSEMYEAIDKIKTLLLNDVDNAEMYKYEKRKYTYTPYSYWDRDDYYFDDDYYYSSSYNKKKAAPAVTEEDIIGNLKLTVVTEDGLEYEYKGKTKAECWSNFFINNTSICFDEVVDYEFS